MADDPKKEKHFDGNQPEDKKISSGDRSGKGRERRDDHVLPEGPGRNTFGTHGGPKEERRDPLEE